MGKVCSITIVYLHGSEEGIELVRVQLDQPVLTFHGIVRQVGAVCQELCKCTGVIDRTWAGIISNPADPCTLSVKLAAAAAQMGAGHHLPSIISRLK